MIELHNMDCMTYMAGLPDKAFDLAIVDPPYGIGEDGSKDKARIRVTAKWKNPTEKGYKAGGWDSATPTDDYFAELFRVSKNQLIWGGNYFSLPPSSCWIVWDKKTSGDFADGELAWGSFDKALRIFAHLWSGFKQAIPEHRIHPTQKPVALYEWLLTKYAKPGQRILDTHLGSGSSAIAAHNLGFDFVGTELDADYYAAACKRFEAHKAQGMLFQPDDYDRVERDYRQGEVW